MSHFHLSTVKQLMQKAEPFDLTLWTAKGEIQHWHNCLSLHYDFYSGTRNIKLLDSRQIRKVRDICIFEFNGVPVFL